jgi:hypothetical protein
MSEIARGTATTPVAHRRAPRRSTMFTLRTRLLRGLIVLLAGMALSPASALAFDHSFIGGFNTVTPIASTVPANGDLNPYGIATVPSTIGSLVAGDLLISNFNNAENLQGTGTTIVQVTPGGKQSLFAHINPATLPGHQGGVGLTTALAVLPHGYVVVGSLPTTNGSSSTAKAGSLIVLNSVGHVVETFAGGPINGPWDLTAVGFGDNTTLFVTNVLNGTVASGETPTDGGTVLRIGLNTTATHPPLLTSAKVIGTGFPERTDEAALVVGPTGVGLAVDGTLYVADTQGNRIAAIPNALFRQVPLGGAGITVARAGFLNNPLGLTIAPDGGIVTANANDGNIVETTPFGAEFHPFETTAGAGGLFGLTLSTVRPGVDFVNDTENTVELLH